MANVSLTSYASQLAEIDRQKRLANLLQTQAQEPIEIQSYKGTQAAIPLTSVLAKLLNQVGGQMKEARAIKREGELSAKDREVAQNLIGGRVSTAKISDIPQPRSLGVAMGKMPQGTPESRLVQQAQAAPMGELPPLPTPGPGLTPEAQFMQRAAPQTIPSPGAMMNIPSQGAPMGMPPSAPPMGGPLRPPLPMMNIPQAKDRARTPTEQIEAGQRALLDPMSGPVARAMAERVILRGETKQDAAEERAQTLSDRQAEITRLETQRLALIDEKNREQEQFIKAFSGEIPKDKDGNPLVSAQMFNAMVRSGDRAGAVKMAVDAGADYTKAQAAAVEAAWRHAEAERDNQRAWQAHQDAVQASRDAAEATLLYRQEMRNNRPEFTQTQGLAATFADRMNVANNIISNNGVATSAQSRVQAGLSRVPIIGNSIVSSNRQAYEQARRNFITAKLRRESGAAILDSEFATADKQYFPQPGDSQDVLRQKAYNRQLDVDGMIRDAGPNYRPPTPMELDPTADAAADEAEYNRRKAKEAQR